MERRLFVAAGLAATGLAAPFVARAADADTLTVGGVQLPTNAPLFIANERGYFAREGLKVNFVWFTAAASVFSAVVSRDLDVGTTGTTAATFNLAARGGFKIIGGTTRDAPHFPLNGVLASNKAWDAGFTTLDGMGGKRWAMTTAGSTFHYEIAAMARKHGVPLGSLQLVPLESYPNMAAALGTGQVDAALLSPALTKRALDAHGAHLLAWSGDESPMQQGVVCASPQTIATRRDTLARFMRAYAQGAADYSRTFNQLDASGQPAKGPDYDALLDVIARGAGIKPAEVAAAPAYIIADLRPDEADIRRQIAFWQEAALVSKSADFKDLFDLSMLPGKPG